MSDCTEFEIALERRRHGDLSPSEAEALTTHLETCTSCRQYESLMTGTEVEMQATTVKVTREIRWADLEQRVQHTLSRYRKSLPRMAGALLVLVPLIGWTAGLAAGGLSLVIGVGILVAGTAMVRRISHDAARAEAQEGELLVFLREELDRRVKRMRTALVVELAIGAFLVTLMGLNLAGSLTLAMPTKLVLFNLAWGVALLVAGLLRAFFWMPRAVAQRTALG